MKAALIAQIALAALILGICRALCPAKVGQVAAELIGWSAAAWAVAALLYCWPMLVLLQALATGLLAASRK